MQQQAPGFNIMAQPMVQDMALQYGQQVRKLIFA